MKNRLAVVVALALCLFSAAFPKSAWATDPGTRYSDAFVLIQQAQVAEERSDLPTAYRKYLAARDILRAVRTDSPEWNSQMVEYRLKDCESHFDAIKAKLPNPPPAPADESHALVTPPVRLVSNEQSSPAPAPVAKTKTDDQAAKLQSQIDTLQKENTQLKSDLANAKRTPKSSAQLDALTKENKDLKSQLAAAEKKAAPAESAELKKLRADAEKARKSASDLEKKNTDLGSQLAAAKKQAADSADAKSADLKKLRADLDKARAEADAAKKSATQVADLQKQNKDLSTQLAAAKKEASARYTPPVLAPGPDSAELKKLRADLDAARADAAQSKKNAARAADLDKANKDLSAKLSAAEKKVSATPADSAEVKNLRAQVADLKKQVAAKPAGDSAEVKTLRNQLADSRKELDQAKKSTSQVADLQKQNKDLSTQLAAAKKEASARYTPPVLAPTVDSADLKKLRAEADSARADAEKARKTISDLEKKNADLSSKLAAEAKTAAPAAAAEPADARVMKQLRNENSYLRNLLDTYAAKNPELKGQLRHHDQNQPKNSQ